MGTTFKCKWDNTFQTLAFTQECIEKANGCAPAEAVAYIGLFARKYGEKTFIGLSASETPFGDAEAAIIVKVPDTFADALRPLVKGMSVDVTINVDLYSWECSWATPTAS